MFLSPPQIFHFCSILILLSALMFESGAAIEKEPLVCFKEAAVNATDAKAEEEKIAASQYLLVVFVIAIVVVSTLYFFAALIGELSRSCSHFLKVNRSRKNDRKKINAKDVNAKDVAKSLWPDLSEKSQNPIFDERTSTNPVHTRVSSRRQSLKSRNSSQQASGARVNPLLKQALRRKSDQGSDDGSDAGAHGHVAESVAVRDRDGSTAFDRSGSSPPSPQHKEGKATDSPKSSSEGAKGGVPSANTSEEGERPRSIGL